MAKKKKKNWNFPPPQAYGEHAHTLQENELDTKRDLDPPPVETPDKSSQNMESVPYEIIAASKPFRFLVGPNKKEFMMHVDLVAHLSKPLATLVNGKMKEAKEGIVEWPEVHEGTFIRFCQFAYTGKYVAAVPQRVPESKREDDDCIAPVKEKKGHCLIKPSERPRLSEILLEPLGFFFGGAWNRFKETTFTAPEPYKLEEYPSLAPITTSEVLLSHARLYVLADYYDIERLMVLSLENLHQAIVQFDLERDIISAITTLSDYCFTNTVDKSGAKDSLRVLVTRCIAGKIDKLWDRDHFQEVFETYPDLSNAVMGELLEWMTL
ncbi:hypothetical protein F5X99DRAFT_374446 [Biscogniauxia marginata]|nr:hypothetical protein F5X99DRAFT_374446 [Biscogniauxia marginata]